VRADALKQAVVAPVGERLAIAVAQQLPVPRGVPFLAVPDQRGHQSGGDRLPAERLALFPEQDQALLRVQVQRAQREGAASPAGGLGVQPQDQRVELMVIARGRGDLVDLRQLSVGDGPAGGGQPAGLVDLASRVVLVVDHAVVLGLVV
jgi:hypothetical protein